MRSVSDLISAVKARQAVIKEALASGNPADWAAYQRLVGEHAGLERTLGIINDLLKEKDEDE